MVVTFRRKAVDVSNETRLDVDLVFQLPLGEFPNPNTA